jgi:hypothetical protein
MSDQKTVPVKRVRLIVDVDVDVSKFSIATSEARASEYPVDAKAARLVRQFLDTQEWAHEAYCIYVPPMLKSDREEPQTRQVQAKQKVEEGVSHG